AEGASFRKSRFRGRRPAKERVNEIGRGHSPPCITARRGGCVIKKNVAQQPKRTQPGWFSLCIHRKTTPASRSAELRDIFLIARPPLLAVMQGGEWPARNMVAIFFTASPSAPLRTLRDNRAPKSCQKNQ